MGAIPERKAENRKSSSSQKSIFLVIGIIAAIALAGVGYLMMFVEPEIIEERVKVIAVTESGCVVETFDGYAVNVGQCNALPGDYIIAPIDQKVKERAAAMNPTD